MSFTRHLGLLATLVFVAPGLAAEPPAKPNVVFILADDLGVNDLGCYGRTEHHTPHLDRLASDGARFTAAYAACPVCSPTRAAIMTGKHPARLHITTFLPGRGDAPSQKLLHPKIAQQLPLEEKTVAEHLKGAGYATACIGKWHLGGANFGPEKQGFDVVYAGKANTPATATEGGKGERDLTKKAEEFITANRDKPFFLYLAHNTPHIPLGAKKELVEKYAKCFNPTYAAMMHEMDESVGRVLAKLDELKLTDRTLVVFTSDNGGLHVPELKDDPPTHNTPSRAGKGFLYEGGIRVPLIVRYPGAVAAKQALDTPVISTDWTPTLLELCGIKPTEPLDGTSLAGVLKGEKLEPRPLFWHVPHYTNQGSRPGAAVREGDWKLIEHYEDGTVELFDLKADPGESKDVARTEPRTVARLQTKLKAWRASVKAQENATNPAFDTALHKTLYVDTDVSKLKPAATAAETAKAVRAWRTAIDEVVAKKPAAKPADKPGAVPEKLREELNLKPFYQKYADAGGLPVVGSAKVTDNALAEAAWIVGRMLDGRPDVLKAMKEARVRVVVMAATEATTDVPEHSYLTPKLVWDRRARGLGATPLVPAVSCGEENLLGYPGDPYPNENIFVHEFGHAIHGTGLNKVDPTFDKRLRAAYSAAMDRGLWKNTYAATNHSEYWAEGVQCWFDDNAPPDALHNDVRTRAKLKEYDPALAKLCEEVFGDKEWRYKRPTERKPEDRKHLVEYDAKALPRFTWKEAPIGDTARATIQTAVGEFDVELDAKAAPEATALFLKIALHGGYHGGQFFRVVRDDKKPATGTITASAKPNWIDDATKRFKLEQPPASKTAAKDGTIAFVRNGTALGEFVIFVGPPPEKAGDIVPFGRVVKGADVVRKILEAPLDGEKPKPAIDIRRVVRTE